MKTSATVSSFIRESEEYVTRPPRLNYRNDLKPAKVDISPTAFMAMLGLILIATETLAILPFFLGR